MESWEHCSKRWYEIDIVTVVRNINRKSILKCKLNNKEYIFNIPDKINLKINLDMMKNGNWYVYTWS